MKSFIVLALCVAVAVALPLDDSDAVVVKQELDNIGVDGYKSAYETSNGIVASEEGQLKNPGQPDEALQVRGQFSYTGPDGVIYSVVYEAGPQGFVASGAHIPQA